MQRRGLVVKGSSGPGGNRDSRSNVWVALWCRGKGKNAFKQATTLTDRCDALYRFRLVLPLGPVIENNALRIVEISSTAREILPTVVGIDRFSMAIL